MANREELQSSQTVHSFEVRDAYRQPVEMHENSDPPQGETLRAIRDLIVSGVKAQRVSQRNAVRIPPDREYENPHIARAFDRNGAEVRMYEIEDLPREAVLKEILATLQEGLQLFKAGDQTQPNT